MVAAAILWCVCLLLKDRLVKELGKKVIDIINVEIDNDATVKRIEFVGPSVGSELAQTGAMALLSALICILIYVGFRFEWRLALGAVISLAHDVVITFGYFITLPN